MVNDKIQPTPDEVGAALQACRRATGETQEQVAQAAGMQRGTYNRYENVAGEERYKIVPLLRHYAQNPESRPILAEMLGLQVEEPQDPPELRRWIDILRGVWGTDKHSFTASMMDALVRGLGLDDRE